jgi:hypothetical protein
MAYNPGVSDISGQIRAQGMTRGINSLLEGFDVGVKTYQQNKQIADNSIADFGAAVANSESLKALLADEEKRATLPSDVVKAYLKLNKEGSLGAREASLLGGFARSYTKNEEDKQQRALRDAQMAQIAQQGTIAKQASDLATQQGVRQQAEFSAMEDMNKKFRDLAALGAGGSPNDAEPEAYADVEGAQKRQREYEAAKAFLNSSAGKYVAAGGVLTPQLTAQFNIADQTSNARISAAEAEANQRAEEYRARAAAAETKLGEDPTPLIGSIRRALKEGTITQAQANQYMSDIFIKGGTVPESLSSQVEAAVSRGMGGKGTPTPTSAPMPTATPTTPTSAPAKYPTYRPDQLRSIPLDSEFTTTDGRLMYKDKGGIIRPGGRPTK